MSKQRPTRTRPTLGWWYTAVGAERQRNLFVLAAVLAVAVVYPLFSATLCSLSLFLCVPQTSVIPVLLFVVLALGLNVVVGFAGLLDLGYAAFFAIGAYTAAFLTSTVSPIPGVREHPVPFFAAMVGAAVVAALFGVILGAPTLRLRGDYLAIVTLGFGEIVPLVIRNTPEVTKGIQGMNPIGYPEVPGVKFGISTEPWYYLILAVLVLSVILTSRLRTSRIGRAWMAIREDEVAAASMGVNPVTTKLFAFSLGASFSGFSGSIWASYLQVITPEQFDFSVSIFVLSMIIVGGMGNIYGVIVGGLLLGGFDRLLADRVNEALRVVAVNFDIEFLKEADLNRAKTMVFGLALVIMMLVKPEGFFPSARRKMELHAAEESETEAAQQRASLYEARR